MTLISAFNPGRTSPRSWRPKSAALSAVSRRTANSSGSRGPRRRSRTQWVNMNVVIVASQTMPQHLVHRIEIAAVVVEKQEEQQLTATGAEHEVVQHGFRMAPVALRDGRDALPRGRLIV